MANSTELEENTVAPHTPNRIKKRRRLLLMLLTVAILIAAGIFGYYELYGRYYESTDDAYVNGNLNDISSQINGTITQVYAEDGDFVKKGQPLVTLDDNQTSIALDNAEANLANVVRQTRGLYSDVDNYRAQVEIKEVNYRQALADYKRRQKLAHKGAISVEELNHYRDALTSAKNELISVKQTLKAKLALTEGVPIEKHPAIKSAITKLQQAYLNQLYTSIKAPVDGYIAQRQAQVGEQVTPATKLMVIVPLHQVWIDANFKENQLRDMRIGQSVDITTDLYGDDVHYSGHVESLGIGTGSAFALLPAQNATGNWIKIVQRLPVRIALNSKNLDKYPLRIGLSSYVTVHLTKNSGPLLSKQPLTKPRFSTNIYNNQLESANHLIAKILTANGINAEKALKAVKETNHHE
ncbi:efflux RND transporter periplasmic adaptor subunit [Celerinatantimonas diazotrophica]|uniref:Membrane fusion protein (Multidrug efflux system) n=1 Tax=Celerinatantimonas diazotrophica TaxID=412034 RepID=A0A4R1K534_9GAMM|nr:efflux RND transporter periplasmic adaptor subunit [Celerinatantimonas diazotrophica]TCK59060.1 membrane fusion protein (multidrug efflux system) [Celerinatantimonas diazotrophica]CAG9297695.1 Multidrug export protein EmrA [Celerinatantimonas diazotrophica]